MARRSRPRSTAFGRSASTNFAACGMRRFAQLRRQASPRISSPGFFAGTSRSRRGLDPQTAKHLASFTRGTRSPEDRPRRLKPGTVLVREYQGERHTVTVVANGFVWREATYASLSTIARAITGTNWNGPRFFGLRIDKESTVSPEKADAPPRSPNGRTPAQATGSKPRRAVARGRPSGNATPAHSALGDGEPRQ
jgi:hypothetical protein